MADQSSSSGGRFPKQVPSSPIYIPLSSLIQLDVCSKSHPSLIQVPSKSHPASSMFSYHTILTAHVPSNAHLSPIQVPSQSHTSCMSHMCSLRRPRTPDRTTRYATRSRSPGGAGQAQRVHFNLILHQSHSSHSPHLLSHSAPPWSHPSHVPSFPYMLMYSTRKCPGIAKVRVLA